MQSNVNIYFNVYTDNNVTRKNNDIGQEVVRTHDTKSSIFAQSNPIESESDYQSSQSLIVRKTNRTYGTLNYLQLIINYKVMVQKIKT